MHHMTIEEIKEMVKVIPQPRHKLMLKVAFLHGLRVSEVIHLVREDIRDGYVNVQRLKGSRRTIQPYVRRDDELDEAKELTELYKKLKPGERLFPMTRFGVYKLMKRVSDKTTAIPAHKLHPHALKHSCAMVSIDTAGIHRVRQYLGHESISSTGEYLKVSDEEASAAFQGAF